MLSVLETDPPRLVIPLPGPAPSPHGSPLELPVFVRCLQASLDEAFIRDSYLPSLVDKYFGKDARDLHFDVLIALTARSCGACLITSNRADFELIRGYRDFELEVW